MRINTFLYGFVNDLYSCGCVLSLGVFLSSCASRTPSYDVGQKFVLALSAEKGRVEQTDWYSGIARKQIEDQISRNEIESVNFRTEVKTLSVEGDGKFAQVLRVVSKEGDTDLHELAFPEVGETLDLIITPSGQILKAGAYPKDSIFYVPQVPLPTKPVAVGDTWSLDSSWVSENGMRMEFHLITILKRVVDCGLKPCLDLEISGNVTIPALGKDIQLKNDVWGRLLFSHGLGAVVWSEVRSRLTLNEKGSAVSEESCLQSVMRTPLFDKISAQTPLCQVPSDGPIVVPL